MVMSKSSSQACIAIDGDRIKQYRESLGLTQLYISTSLGVTVDTVSRWENNRSPNIKLENAEKLAEILEISINEISKSTESIPDSLAIPDLQDKPSRQWNKWLIAACVAAGVFLFISFRPGLSPKGDLAATRYLPIHASPAQPFPVILKVSSSYHREISFIVREVPPPSCQVLKSEPQYVANGNGSEIIKWLSSTNGEEKLYFAYLLKAEPGIESESVLSFSGNILVEGNKTQKFTVQGHNHITIMNYHWADTNRDTRIDDCEILTIYNSFDILQELGVDIGEIRQIWAGKGYRWLGDEEKFVIIP